MNTQTTLSLKIFISDSLGNIAAYSDYGLTFTPIPGALQIN